MKTIIKTTAKNMKVDLELFMKISKIFADSKPKMLRHKVLKPLSFHAYTR